MFLDRNWFTLETASTLIANHSGLLHAPVPVQAPAAAAEAAEPVRQQQHGKQKQAKQQKQKDRSTPPPPPVLLTAVEAAAAAISGTNLLHSFVLLLSPLSGFITMLSTVEKNTQSLALWDLLF